jgi:hypothetical protein
MRAIINAALAVEAADIVGHGLEMDKGADAEAAMERRKGIGILCRTRALSSGCRPCCGASWDGL